MRTTPEIIIIGAGSTGLATAIFLTERGFPVRIFDKRERVPITKALGVNPVSLQLLSTTGITQRFMDNGWACHSSNFWYKNQLVYHNSFEKLKHPYPFMLIQPQYQTEAIMEGYLGEKGIKIERSLELEDLETDGLHTQLMFKNCHNERLETLQTMGLVVGADGNKSKVRELMNIPLQGWEHDATYTLHDIEIDTPLHQHQLHYLFEPEGGMLMLHIKDGVWRVGGNIPGVLKKLPKGTKVGKITWETHFTIREMVAKTLQKGSVFVLGDAAHVHSPLGGKGMNMCIEDGYLFAQYLAENRLDIFSKYRLKKLNQTVGMLGQLTEIVGGQHWAGKSVRSQMKNFSFLFPLFMPYMRQFLLGLK